MSGPLLRIESLDLAVTPFDWRFARERRAEIDAHFEVTRRDKPRMWNGRVLLTHRYEIDGGCLHGRYFETDFASFLAWRDFGFPDVTVRNGFALAALQGSDGAYVLGVMGSGTVNAGKIYFPGGTPDLNDVVGNRLDLEANVRRELQEETGLDPQNLDIDPGWQCLLMGSMVAHLKLMRARETGAELRERIQAHIARQAVPELADAFVARGAADIHPMMPAFIQTFLRNATQ